MILEWFPNMSEATKRNVDMVVVFSNLSKIKVASQNEKNTNMRRKVFVKDKMQWNWVYINGPSVHCIGFAQLFCSSIYNRNQQHITR